MPAPPALLVFVCLPVATANVQAVKVVRTKRLVGEPEDEHEPVGADSGAAAGALAGAAIHEQKQQHRQKKSQEEAAAKAATGASCLPATLPAFSLPFGLAAPPALSLLPLPQPLPGVAGVPQALQQAQQAFTPMEVGSQVGKAAAGQLKSSLGKGAAGAGDSAAQGAAETGSTAGKKRRGRPPKHAREEDGEATPPTKRPKQPAGSLVG